MGSRYWMDCYCPYYYTFWYFGIFGFLFKDFHSLLTDNHWCEVYHSALFVSLFFFFFFSWGNSVIFFFIFGKHKFEGIFSFLFFFFLFFGFVFRSQIIQLWLAKLLLQIILLRYVLLLLVDLDSAVDSEVNVFIFLDLLFWIYLGSTWSLGCMIQVAKLIVYADENFLNSYTFMKFIAEFKTVFFHRTKTAKSCFLNL